MKKLLTIIPALAITVSLLYSTTVFASTTNRGYISRNIEQGIEFIVVDEELFEQNSISVGLGPRMARNLFSGTPINISTFVGGRTVTGRWWGGFVSGSVVSQVIANPGASGRASVTVTPFFATPRTTSSAWARAGVMAEAWANAGGIGSARANWDLQ